MYYLCKFLEILDYSDEFGIIGLQFKFHLFPINMDVFVGCLAI